MSSKALPPLFMVLFVFYFYLHQYFYTFPVLIWFNTVQFYKHRQEDNGSSLHPNEL